MTLQTWLAFFAACWAISLSPGAGAVAAMASGTEHGFRRSYWTILGLQLGFLSHLAIVAAGIGAVLAASDTAFAVIKWLGVAYLLYLGMRQWYTAGAARLVGPASVEARPPRQVARGFLVNAANPKSMVFMLAVIPQFLAPGEALLPQYAVMAATMVTVDLVVMGAYALFASRLLAWLREPRHVALLNRAFGALFVAAALALAAFRRQPPA
ncbi:MAG TPA: LysE family transporter [Pelomicrobium sp.]|nr:LysE family transporter [Pelomicrobium sp.]